MIVPKLIDLTGQRFERLTVLGIADIPDLSKYKSVHWRCQCDCGEVVVVRGNNLKSGLTKSCGCLRVEAVKHTQKHHRWKHDGC